MRQSSSEQYLSAHYNNQLPDLCISPIEAGAVDIIMGGLGVLAGIALLPEASVVAGLAAVGFISGGIVQGSLGVTEIAKGETAPSVARLALAVGKNPLLLGILADLLMAGVEPQKAMELVEKAEAIVASTELVTTNSPERLAAIHALLSQQVNKGLEEGENACHAQAHPNTAADKSRTESARHERTGSGVRTGNRYSSRLVE